VSDEDSRDIIQHFPSDFRSSPDTCKIINVNEIYSRYNLIL
jgi:hypothetical protein